MKKLNLISLGMLLFATLISLASCQAIGDIFKAGVWVGILAVVLIIALVLWLISRAGKK